MENKRKYCIIFYEDRKGNCPTEEFLQSLSIKIRAKVVEWVDKLEEYGSDLPRPYADIIRGKIRELRVIFSSMQYRLLYFFYGKYIVITHGFIKKTDRVPGNEIARVQDLMADFEERAYKGEIEL